MTLKKITGKDIKEALDALTPYGEGDVVWLKELGKTDGGDMNPVREAAPEITQADVVETHTSLACG